MAGILGMILAGGEGSRLQPLTESRTKPAVPFGGSYRLIDFVLNNFVNSDYLKIYILTQFKSQSLNVHLRQAWNLSGISDRFIEPIPAQMRKGKHWYNGTADAIYQNISFVESNDPDHVAIFGSDHIYKMNIRQMVDQHKANKAALTIAAIKVPLKEARAFGVIEVDETGRVLGFQEKPEHPKSIPGDPDHALASMGNYVFEAKTLLRELRADAEKEDSTNDFGKDIIPGMYKDQLVYVYDYTQNKIDGEENSPVYWRDVGTIDAYWHAHMDLLKENPEFSLYNRSWSMHTYYPPVPPALFNDTKESEVQVSSSLISAGCQVSGSHVDNSVMGFRCVVEPKCHISETIMLGDVKIGKGCSITRCVIDKDAEIAAGTVIGQDLEQDSKLFKVSEEGIVVIPKRARVGFDD